MLEYETLSAADAHLYLHLKDKLPSGYLVNIQGKVTAISEIFRVKKDLLFLVEIENNVKIIVKQKQYLQWQEQITPEMDYVFTNLRGTTLQKGSVSPFKVFIPWSNSTMHQSSDKEYRLISLKQSLHEKNIEYSDITTTGTPVHLKDVRSVTKFVSYQGVITNCDQADVGIYELDNRIGLCVSCVPTTHTFKALTLGTKIIVYNAHRLGFADVPKIRLFGCVSTVIRVTETDQQPSVKQSPVSSILLKAITVFSLTFREIAALMDMPSVLANKLNIPNCTFSTASIINLIPRILNSSCCPWLQEDPRNLLQEFLEVPHDCCVAKLKKTSRIPSISCVQKEKENLFEMAHDMTDLQQKYYGSCLPVSELNQLLYWSLISDAMQSNTEKILIGYLQCDPVTGRLQLQDATEAVDVVIRSFNPKGSHVCCAQCLHTRPGSFFKCPVFHPFLKGCLVCVRKYKRIIERFHCMDTPNSYHIESKYIKRSRYVVYLMFSLTDCVLLHALENKFQLEKMKDLPRCQSEELTSVSSAKKRKVDKQSDEYDAAVSKLVYVSHKESLLTVNRNVWPYLRFCVLGHFIKDCSSSVECDLTKYNVKSQSVCELSSKDLCHSEKESCQRRTTYKTHSLCYTAGVPSSSGVKAKRCNHNEESIDSKSPGQCSERPLAASGELAQATSSRARDTNSCGGDEISSDPKLTGQCPREQAVSRKPIAISQEPVVLLFQNNIEWFSVIQTDAFYRLTVRGDANAFQTQLLDERLQKAAVSSRARMFIQVPADTIVSRVFKQGESLLENVDTSTLDQTQQIDIEDIISNSCSASQVNFSGRIISRTHKPQETISAGRNKNSAPTKQLQQTNERLGVSVLDNSSVCLVVQSLKSQSNISVYMNLYNTSYPLGLLPGMGVCFHRLERKVSRIEKVYCQYTVVSTVDVFQVDDVQKLSQTIPASSAVGNSAVHNDRTADNGTILPHQYLVDVWRNSAPAQLFSTNVYICHFMKLCLKSICCTCGSIVSSVGCSSPACNQTNSYLNVRISILVDDGTSPAVVTFCNCPKLIQKLLRLSEEQWHHLEIATQDQGDVFMQQFIGDGETVLESFLIWLCNSPHVKRHCQMSLQHKTTQNSGCNTWKTGVVDIKEMAKDEFSYHSIKALSHFETRCVPYLQLECVGLEEIHY